MIPSGTVSPLAGIKAAAGSGTSVAYQPGLPVDTALPAIPSSDLSPAYAPTPFGGSYTGTLTAPETGTYVLAITNPCGCYTSTYLSLDGKQIIDDPSTPPVHTYSVAVQLTPGRRTRCRSAAPRRSCCGARRRRWRPASTPRWPPPSRRRSRW